MRLILADAHEICRQGVRTLLSDVEWVDVVGEAADVPALLDLVELGSSDAVLLDPNVSDGLEILEQLPALGSRVLVLTSVDDPALVRRAIESGAAGYLLKGVSPGELITALRRLADGQHYLQADLVTAALFDPAAMSPTEVRARISPRQLDILRLVAAGLDNREVARELGISETTVKSHLRLIYTHLDARNRVEAVATAVRLGLVE